MSIDLVNIASTYRIITDTSSLMHPLANMFYCGPLRQVLTESKAKLVIYSNVIREIDKKSMDPKKPYSRRVAKSAAEIIKYLWSQQLIEYVEKEGSFADIVLLSECIQLRKDHNIAIITQDTDLSGDILNTDNIRSVRYTKDLQALRLSDSGQLMNWKEMPATRNKRANNRGKILTLSSSSVVAAPSMGSHKLAESHIKSSRHTSSCIVNRPAGSGQPSKWKRIVPYSNGSRPVNNTGKILTLPSARVVAAPSICSHKPAESPIKSSGHKSSSAVSYEENKFIQEKNKKEAVVRLPKKLLINAPVSRNMKSRKKKRHTMNINFVERFFRSVSETFSQQG